MVDVLDVGYYFSYCMSEIIHPACDKKGAQRGKSPCGVLNFEVSIPIAAFTDNESLYRNAYASTMVSEHRLRIDLAIIKQMLENKELEGICLVSSSAQLADCLTKVGADPIKLLCALESGKVNI